MSLSYLRCVGDRSKLAGTVSSQRIRRLKRGASAIVPVWCMGLRVHLDAPRAGRSRIVRTRRRQGWHWLKGRVGGGRTSTPIDFPEVRMRLMNRLLGCCALAALALVSAAQNCTLHVQCRRRRGRHQDRHRLSALGGRRFDRHSDAERGLARDRRGQLQAASAAPSNLRA